MKPLRHAITLLFALTVLAACQTHENASVSHLSPQAFADRIQTMGDSVLVVDVRTPGEFAEGHIAGAQLLDFNGPGFAEAVTQLPKDKSLAIYCRSGARSKASLSVFLKAGFQQVANLESGIIGWQRAGFPLTTNP